MSTTLERTRPESDINVREVTHSRGAAAPRGDDWGRPSWPPGLRHFQTWFATR